MSIASRLSILSNISSMSFFSNISLKSKESVVEDDVLVVLKNSSHTKRDSSFKEELPSKCINADKKAMRVSALGWDGASGELLIGKDLADIFERIEHVDRDSSMRTSISNVSRGSDRRGSMTSLMSFAYENQDLDLHGIRDNMNNNLPAPDCNYRSTHKSTENNVASVNNDIRNNTHTSAIHIPSTQRFEEITLDHLNFNNSEITSPNQEKKNDRIEHIEKVGPYDIICGRNNGAHDSVGNRRFRVTIMMNLKKYSEASTREEKTLVIKSVIELLLDKNGVGARFIKKIDDGIYERLNDKQIREKVGHAFRDMMSLEEKGLEELTAKCFR